MSARIQLNDNQTTAWCKKLFQFKLSEMAEKLQPALLSAVQEASSPAGTK